MGRTASIARGGGFGFRSVRRVRNSDPRSYRHSRPIAESGGGQRRSLAQETDGTPPGQGEQHVVGTVAVVIHAHGLLQRVF